MKAVELLGARCRITGVRPAVAQTMVELGINLGTVRAAARNLKHALREEHGARRPEADARVPHGDPPRRGQR